MPRRGRAVSSQARRRGAHSVLRTRDRAQEALVGQPVGMTQTTTRISAGRSLLDVGFPELWRHRELLFFLTWRDLKIRYKQTVFGAGWAVLQPLLLMVVFSV